MLVFCVLVTVATLRPWPHTVATGDEVVQVNATGEQWSWEIDTREIPVGKMVVFNLHTKDVNHGFGVSAFTAPTTLRNMSAMTAISTSVMAKIVVCIRPP